MKGDLVNRTQRALGHLYCPVERRVLRKGSRDSRCPSVSHARGAGVFFDWIPVTPAGDEPECPLASTCLPSLPQSGEGARPRLKDRVSANRHRRLSD